MKMNREGIFFNNIIIRILAPSLARFSVEAGRQSLIEMVAVSTHARVRSQFNAYSKQSLWLIAVCFVLSGATGLIYEVLWARMLGLVFGATTFAISAVLAAFMGGLALGSAWS